MSRKRLLPLVLGFVLTFLMLHLVALPAAAQEPGSQPSLDVYFIHLQPWPDATPDAASSFQTAYERLEPVLLELSADGQVAAYEYLPGIRSVRVIASLEAMTLLASRPEVGEIRPLHSRPAPAAEPPHEAVPAPATAGTGSMPADAPSSSPAPSRDDAWPAHPAAPGLTYTISGTVRDYDGTPLKDVYVSTDYRDPMYVSVYTDAGGDYALTVNAGTYHISASKYNVPGPPEQTVTVPPNQTADFTFPRRYTISGKVLDWDGTPIKNANVSTEWSDPHWTETWTDGTGAYVLTVSAGTYHVSVDKTDLPSPPGQTITVPPNQVVNFTYPRRYTISGTVRDHNGTPLWNAWVSTNRDDPVYASARTDATGRYILAEILPGTYHVSVASNPLPPPPEQVVTVPPDQVVDFTFPQRYTISGKVLDWDGTPIVGARVSTQSDDPYWTDGLTDVTGAYALTVSAGTYHVSVHKSGLGNLPKQTVTVPPNQAVNFTYPRRYTISGKVLDWDGTPIVGAWVSTQTDDPAYASAKTDATGMYTLTVSALGTYHVSVSKDPLPGPPAQIVTIPPNQVVNFTFAQRYTISGKVLDWEGTPVAAATVSAHLDDRAFATAKTDASGAYTLTVTAGTYRVSAYKSGHAYPPDCMATVPPDLTGVNFTFPRPYPISGTVRDAAGRPIQGADIWGGLKSVTTAADGTYTTMAAPGEHYVSAHKEGHQYAASVLVPIPPAALGVDFVLLANDQTIRGRVVDKQGQPLVDAYVSADNIVCYRWGSASTRVAADGAYTLSLPSGTYHVTAGKNGYIPAPPKLAEVPVSAAQAAAITLDFTLEPLVAYTVRGVVRDSLGQSVEDALVRADACGLSYISETDATGAYTLTLGADTYSVYASKRNYGDSPAQTVVAPPNADHVDFILPPTYAISGRVTDPQGHPIENVYANTDWNGLDSDSDLTDADGRYTLSVVAGSYQVGAELEDYSRPAKRAVSVPPDQTGIDFVLSPLDGHRIRGTVRDGASRGVAGASVCPTLAGESSSFACRTTYYNGVYTKLLPAGAYSVYVWASCYASTSTLGVTLPPDQTGLDFTLRLRDQLIAGRAIDSDGQPVCGATVRAQDGFSTSGRSERNGRYALQLPAGTFTISAAASGYLAPSSKTVTVPPFATAVDFVFQAPNKSTVQGIVRDSHGAPMAGVSMAANGPNGNAATVTGPDGRYTLQVVDGSWIITPSKAGYMAFPFSRSVVTPPNQTGVDFTLVAQSEIESLYLPLVLRPR